MDHVLTKEETICFTWALILPNSNMTSSIIDGDTGEVIAPPRTIPTMKDPRNA